MIALRAKAETYEERADVAEYQVERLEGMVYRFFRTYKDDQEKSLNSFREEWKRYQEDCDE